MSKAIVQTVLGAIDAALLGKVLIHEHILVDFIGAGRISKNRYDPDDVLRRILPYLESIRKQGIQVFVECTPSFLGRDAALLIRLSEASGLHFLVNTGFYAAGERPGESEPFLPAYAYELSAEALAGGWLKEWYEGIEGTEARPGFIKIGVNRGKLRPISQKIVRAAAITSRHSGLVIACHTGLGRSALEAVGILEEENVAPNRFIFVHAQGEKDPALHAECARRGVWMEYDGIGPESSARHRQLLLTMLERGYENQLLISQDAGWYRPGEQGGGKIRGYDYLMAQFIPSLLQEGVPSATVDHLLIHNPIKALQITSQVTPLSSPLAKSQ